MIPLVWFYVISRFSFSGRATVFGAFIICLSLLLMGEQHRSFGNFAFNRIFQGKTVLLTIGIPLFAGLTMDFFRKASLKRWLYLFVSSMALVGFSSCACMLVPLLAVVLAIVLLGKRDRRFLIIWIVSMLVCYLNPIIAPILIKHVTSRLLYWRVFYLYPFPLVVGLSAAALTLRLESQKVIWQRVVFGAVILLLLLGHLPLWSPSVFRGRTKLGFPRYKVRDLTLAEEVLALAVPPGTMLAPPGVCLLLPLLSCKYPQMFIRKDAIFMWMAQHGEQIEAVSRMRASYFLGGRVNQENFESFLWVIQKHRYIRSIVAAHGVAQANNSYIERLLIEQGFTERRLTKHLAVFIRPSGFLESQHD